MKNMGLCLYISLVYCSLKRYGQKIYLFFASLLHMKEAIVQVDLNFLTMDRIPVCNVTTKCIWKLTLKKQD